MLLKINDETSAGDILNEIELEIAKQEISVKDIIEIRVKREVENCNHFIKLTPLIADDYGNFG